MRYAQTRGFSTVDPNARAPAATIELVPGDFADDFGGKPRANLVFGLRLLSATESLEGERLAKKAADEETDLSEDEQTEFYNERLMEFAVARTLCDPNDVDKPHDVLRFADDEVPLALTRQAIARIFNALEQHLIASSPAQPRATDEELATTAALLSDLDLLSSMDPAKAERVRRYAFLILSDLGDALESEGAA